MILDCVISGRLAGTIDLDTSGGPTLTYSDAYLNEGTVPLSVLVPVRQRRLSGAPLRNWLLGLLPDDDRLLRQLLDMHQISGDPLGLLATPMGMDCAGAVQFCPQGQSGEVLEQGGGQRPVSEAEIAAFLRRVNRSPLQRSWEGLPDTGFSLAGMQPKLALVRDGNGWELPWGAQPSTHIVKMTRSDRFPHETVIEHLTMETARRIGLRASPSRIAEMDGLEVIVVERFDRLLANSATVRIHQEDMCQAFGLSPENKYQNMGGPTPQQIVVLFRDVAPATVPFNLTNFVDLLLFQWAIASSDGHAKNFGIMHLEDEIRLSPGYDMASWLPYRGDEPVTSVSLSMRMGGLDYTVGSTGEPGCLSGFAHSLGVPPAHLLERAEQIATAIPDALESSIEAAPLEFVNHLEIDKFRIGARELSRWAASVAVRERS